MNTKNILIGLGVVVVLFLGMTFPKGNTIVQQVKELAGQSPSGHQFFNDGVTAGGYSATTTGLISAYTTSAKDFQTLPTVISWTPSINQTVTLSATSTYQYVPNVGDSVTLYFRNASTTAAASIVFAAADASVDLQFAEATGGDLTLLGLDWEKITVIRNSRYSVTMIMDEMTEAD
jgi:hypothetical protein